MSDKHRFGLGGAIGLSAAAWTAGFIIYSALFRVMPALLPPAPALFISSVIFMAAAFASVGALLLTDVSRAWAFVLLACAVIGNLLANQLIPEPVGRMVVGYSLILLGFSLGTLISSLVESPRYLLPMCIVAAVADFWSVWAGPTRAIIDSGSEFVMRHAFVAVPVAAVREFQPIVGIGDVIFVALMLCIASRLSLSVIRALLGMFLGLLAGLAVAVAFGGAPGLPFIGAGFAIATWDDIKPGKAEMVTTIVFLIALSAVFGLIVLLK